MEIILTQTLNEDKFKIGKFILKICYLVESSESRRTIDWGEFRIKGWNLPILIFLLSGNTEQH